MSVYIPCAILLLLFLYVNLTIMSPLSSKAHFLAQTRQTKRRTNRTGRTEHQHERANSAPKSRACADVIQLCLCEPQKDSRQKIQKRAYCPNMAFITCGLLNICEYPRNLTEMDLSFHFNRNFSYIWHNENTSGLHVLVYCSMASEVVEIFPLFRYFFQLGRYNRKDIFPILLFGSCSCKRVKRKSSDISEVDG